MIELTPLDVRKKKGDFTRGLRGYDPKEVDQFLSLVAERLEEVVKVNLSLRERVEELTERVQGQEGRERAVQDALVTAQSFKHDIQEQARREADRLQREAREKAQRVHQEAQDEADRRRREANDEAEHLRQDAENTATEIQEQAERLFEGAKEAVATMISERERELADLARRRGRFLESFRMLLERELEVVRLAEVSTPDDEIDLDVLHFGQGARSEAATDEEVESGTGGGGPEGLEGAGRDDAAPAASDAHDPAGESPDDITPEGVVAEAGATGEAEERPEQPAASASEGERAPARSRSVSNASNGSGRHRREAVGSRESVEGAGGEERWGAR